MEQEPGGVVLDVGQAQVDELAAAQGAGVAEQDEGGVAVPDRAGGVGAVGSGQDLAQLDDREGPGLAAGAVP